MHNHDHHDHHLEMGKKFLAGVALNLIFVTVEFFYGWKVHSISLFADAWHNLSDVAGLIISWIAFQMATKKPTAIYTYGYSKGTILASLANCILLFIAVYFMSYEALHRFANPQTVESGTIMWVAGIGILVNTLTALLFVNSNELNNRAAFLHMAADALVSVAVVFGGWLMSMGSPEWIDPALGLIICLVILWGTINLFRSSLRLSLDGVPEGLDIEAVSKELQAIPGLLKIDNLHIWAISTTRNAFTATLEIDAKKGDDLNEIKDEVRSILKRYRVQHTTLETLLVK